MTRRSFRLNVTARDYPRRLETRCHVVGTISRITSNRGSSHSRRRPSAGRGRKYLGPDRSILLGRLGGAGDDDDVFVDGRRLQPSAPATHLFRSCQPCQLSIEAGEARYRLQNTTQRIRCVAIVVAIRRVGEDEILFRVNGDPPEPRRFEVRGINHHPHSCVIGDEALYTYQAGH